MKCKICSNEVRIILDRQFGYNYAYCGSCEFMSRQESQIVSPDREKQEYQTHNNTLEQDGYVEMLNRFLDKSVFPYTVELERKKGGRSNLRALDFGSGPGDCVLAHLLKQNGFQADTYDLFFAPEKVYRDRIYDVITCTEVLEHLKNPFKALRLFKKHLEPGGVLAVTTLFHSVSEDVPGGEEAFQDWWYRRDVTHISFYRPRTFEVIGEKLGFELIYLDDRNTITYRKPQE